MAAGAVRMFGENMKLSHIAAFPQDHRSLHLILNLQENPMSVRQVSTTPHTGRSPRSQCNLDVPSLYRTGDRSEERRAVRALPHG